MWNLSRIQVLQTFTASRYAEPTEYQPSVADVLQVKRYLQRKLPMELIDRIIDEGCYWPHSTVYIERPITVPIYKDGKRSEVGIYIRSLPIGVHGTEGDFRFVEKDFEDGGAAWEKKLRIGGLDDTLPSAPVLSTHPCRKIEFQLWTHDQRLRKQFPHTFTASYVWCDVSIEKLQAPISDTIEWPARFLFDECNAELSIIPRDTGSPFFPPSMKLLKNLAAKTSGSDHTMFWHASDSFDKDADGDCFWQFLDKTFDRQAAKTAEVGKMVRSLQVGDCMTLLAHARFPDSEATVHEARVTVYWAV
ncbi:uncharacterized protein BJ212DRAFT_1300631 [Suillus subaureus]|uniref:Uncharacterized protein n=1 Tax=Suillus subaureus TaxID=48587 RepID=A0A9P7E911_9AGAM|nr:uncharacterized protein BJ212DRAFT_1300631 [Suillus subaureus]KAG1814316.1 hypothetical protein BJ212DRAFT_1300631 [Suillus subaureus]